MRVAAAPNARLSQPGAGPAGPRRGHHPAVGAERRRQDERARGHLPGAQRALLPDPQRARGDRLRRAAGPDRGGGGGRRRDARLPLVAGSRPASVATWSTTAPRRRSTRELRPPLAIFLPDRLALVKGPPAVRRAHLDRLCAALWPARAEPGGATAGRSPSETRCLGRVRSGAAPRRFAGRLGAGAGGAGRGADREPARGGRPAGAGVRRGGGRARPSGRRRAPLPAAHRRRRRRSSWPPSLRERRDGGSGARLHGPRPAPGRARGLARRPPAAPLRLAGRATRGGAGAAVRRASCPARGGPKRRR